MAPVAGKNKDHRGWLIELGPGEFLSRTLNFTGKFQKGEALIGDFIFEDFVNLTKDDIVVQGITIKGPPEKILAGKAIREITTEELNAGRTISTQQEEAIRKSIDKQ